MLPLPYVYPKAGKMIIQEIISCHGNSMKKILKF